MLSFWYDFWNWAGPAVGVPPFRVTLSDAANFSAAVDSAASTATTSTTAASVELDTQ